MKNFDRNHYGYQSLQNAYRVMVQIGDFINEAKKQKENAKRILDIQSSMKGWTGKDVSIMYLLISTLTKTASI